jgi:hypothetical protein
MVAEMLEAERSFLPQFKGESARRVGPVNIPANLARQAAPLDPALSIAHRVGNLASV